MVMRSLSMSGGKFRDITEEKKMDPNSGKLYDSLDEAKRAGVKYPVELFGRRKDIVSVSKAVSKEADRRKKKQRKEAKASRKRNRA